MTSSVVDAGNMKMGHFLPLRSSQPSDEDIEIDYYHKIWQLWHPNYVHNPKEVQKEEA